MKLVILLSSIFVLAAGSVQAQVAIYTPNAPTHRHRHRITTPNSTAGPTYTPVVLTPEEKAAKIILDRMAAKLNNADGVEYTGNITYTIVQNGTPVAAQTTATTTLERTAKLLIQSVNAQQQPDGTMSANGTRFTFYDAVGNKYINVTITPDLYSLQNALSYSGQLVYTKPSTALKDLGAALGFPMIFFNKIFSATSVEQGEQMTFSSTNTTSAAGKPVVLVTETLSTASRGTLAASYMIDPATNLPLQFTQIETRPGFKPVTDLQETFSNFKVLQSPLPLSAYTVVLPTSATLVQANQ